MVCTNNGTCEWPVWRRPEPSGGLHAPRRPRRGALAWASPRLGGWQGGPFGPQSQANFLSWRGLFPRRQV